MKNVKIKNAKWKTAFTLVEVLVAAGLMAIVFVGLATAFQGVIKLLSENKARSTAIALANERMESIRNLSYEDIGTSGGIPQGEIPQEESTTSNGISFVIKTFIQYIDDSADGLDLQDENGVTSDYKKVRVESSWQGRAGEKSVILISNFSPQGIETITGGGTLIIYVLDAALSPLPRAEVKIENSEVSPSISLTTLANDQGKVIFPGSPASDSYEIAVTKTDYSLAQTYPVTAQNPDPSPGHLSILEGKTTEATFLIDRLGSKSVETVLYSEEEPLSPIPNLTFQMRGQKTIGRDAEGSLIYKYSEILATDQSGHLAISNLEWDAYQITVSPNTGYDIMESCPPQPANLLPGDSVITTLTLTAHTQNTFLILVKEGSGGVVEGADIHLFNQEIGYDKVVFSGSCGQAFFKSLVPDDNYSLEVTKEGYQNYLLENVSISGKGNLTVTLNNL
jgi:type II secretory pathway pseudopilin PulG